MNIYRIIIISLVLLKCFSVSAQNEESSDISLQPKTAEEMKLKGDAYYFSHGVAQDYSKAVEWYTKAAAQGYALAISTLEQIKKK